MRDKNHVTECYKQLMRTINAGQLQLRVPMRWGSSLKPPFSKDIDTADYYRTAIKTIIFFLIYLHVHNGLKCSKL